MNPTDWLVTIGAVVCGWIILAMLSFWLALSHVQSQKGRILLGCYVVVSGCAGVWGVIAVVSNALLYQTPLPDVSSLFIAFVLISVFWPLMVVLAPMLRLP